MSERSALAGRRIDVSVIVPAYNAARYLPETLASILDQENVEVEVIVIDDCSSDDTSAVVERFAEADSRVRYLRTASNSGGPAGPRNLGVQAASAPWVAFCDSDDIWHRCKLRAQLDAAVKTNADLVCTGIEDFAGEQKPSMLAMPLPARAGLHRLRRFPMILKNRVATSSVVCRRAAILNAGGFAPDRQLVAVEDYDLWLRLLADPNVSLWRLDATLVAYRRLETSLSRDKIRHAVKVMRVLRRAFEREGFRWAFPLAVPLLVPAYGLLSVYWRVLKGRL